MKTIFGFLTGAAIGAGGLFGLRKVLNSLEGPGVTAVASPAPAPVSVSPGVSPTPESKVITEEAPEVAPVEETPAPISPETLTEEVEVVAVVETAPETPVSLVGEPVARHEEPVAAAESAPDAVTPRSESAEPAVPEKVVVRPAKTASPKSKEAGAAKATSAAEKNGKGGKKTARASRTDDFTTILDIGPVFNQKLHEAGIKSFKDLARLTPAQIEEKTGIPAERIESGRWLEQVQQILAEKPKE